MKFEGKNMIANLTQLMNISLLLVKAVTGFLIIYKPSSKLEVKQNSIGHAILQSSRPRSVIAPTMFGVGIEMDHVFVSRLVKQVSDYLLLCMEGKKRIP